ncbi:MAG TPA: DUF2071 domain-containing protein [Candidatus Eisenbacteria bacterium]|nr:DUF2071 domain-containing protein [Candidatus Eisenbacteria bacterium]
MTRSRVTDQTSHRPWPLPATRWVLTMRWHDLLFLHWPLRRDAIEPLIPKAVELETFDGWCWIGVVPFRMSGVRPPFFPLSMAFPELNVRTYVRAKGKSGVWFFSLDAASPLAVRVARWFGLPYYNARITVLPQAEVIRYESVRFHAHSYAAELIASYRPTGPSYHAKPGSLDHWLTERYSLFGALRPGRVVYGEIHHPQWALQPAEVSLRSNTMARPLDIDLPDIEPVCHYARYQEVVAWPIVPLDRIQ